MSAVTTRLQHDGARAARPLGQLAFLFGASFFGFAALGRRIGTMELVLATVVGRIGLGLILPALNLSSMRDLQPHQLAQSSVVVS